MWATLPWENLTNTLWLKFHFQHNENQVCLEIRYYWHKSVNEKLEIEHTLIHGVARSSQFPNTCTSKGNAALGCIKMHLQISIFQIRLVNKWNKDGWFKMRPVKRSSEERSRSNRRAGRVQIWNSDKCAWWVCVHMKIIFSDDPD